MFLLSTLWEFKTFCLLLPPRTPIIVRASGTFLDWQDHFWDFRVTLGKKQLTKLILAQISVFISDFRCPGPLLGLKLTLNPNSLQVLKRFISFSVFPFSAVHQAVAKVQGRKMLSWSLNCSVVLYVLTLTWLAKSNFAKLCETTFEGPCLLYEFLGSKKSANTVTIVAEMLTSSSLKLVMNSSSCCCMFWPPGSAPNQALWTAEFVPLCGLTTPISTSSSK